MTKNKREYVELGEDKAQTLTGIVMYVKKNDDLTFISFTLKTSNFYLPMKSWDFEIVEALEDGDLIKIANYNVVRNGFLNKEGVKIWSNDIVVNRVLHYGKAAARVQKQVQDQEVQVAFSELEKELGLNQEQEVDIEWESELDNGNDR